MKRVTFNRFASKDLTIALPDDFYDEKLELYLISDCYIGIDQIYSIDLLQINGLIGGKQIKKNEEKVETKGPFEKMSELKKEIVEDILTDEDDKPEMYAQIRSGINSLLDDDDDFG